MDINMHSVFITCVSVEKTIFEILAYFWGIFGPTCCAPGGRAMHFTILISLTIEMLHNKHGNNWPCSSK